MNVVNEAFSGLIMATKFMIQSRIYSEQIWLKLDSSSCNCSIKSHLTYPSKLNQSIVYTGP